MTTKPIQVGSQRFVFDVDRENQGFDIVDQISGWDQYCHTNDYKEMEKVLGGFNKKDQQMLEWHRQVRSKYGWNGGFAGTVFASDSFNDIIETAEELGTIEFKDAEKETLVLKYFSKRLWPWLKDNRQRITDQIPIIVQTLDKHKALLDQMSVLTKTLPDNLIVVHLVPNSSEYSIGGSNVDGHNVGEVPTDREVTGTVLHEAMHGFLKQWKPLMKMVTEQTRFPGVLNSEALNEGISYAISPGLVSDRMGDPLQEEVNKDLKEKRSIFEKDRRYALFNALGLVIRPILQAALAKQVPMEVFIQQAFEACEKYLAAYQAG